MDRTDWGRLEQVRKIAMAILAERNAGFALVKCKQQ